MDDANPLDLCDCHVCHWQAFGVAKFGRAQRTIQRNLDRGQRKDHVDIRKREAVVAPPIVVTVVGPPGVGKTTLIQALVKRFTKHKLTAVTGPITVVTGKKRRITLLECPNDMDSMIVTTLALPPVHHTLTHVHMATDHPRIVDYRTLPRSQTLYSS